MIFFPLSDQPERLAPLCTRPHEHLLLAAVIAGNSPASIWADDPRQPRTAYLWDQAYSHYLLGATDAPALVNLVRDQLQPQMQTRGINLFKLYYAGEDWLPAIEAAYPQADLKHLERVTYRLDDFKLPDWVAQIPAGFAVEPIERARLEDGTLTHADNLIEEIENNWRSLEMFFRVGFGYWVREGKNIAGWCTVEQVSADRCGLGVETIESYQGRGLATLTAAACTAECLRRKMTPHWDSWARNTPSVRVAEKLGYRLMQHYRTYLGQFSTT